MKVVLDTSIFISAAIAPSGPTGEVLELWRQRRFPVILSDATLREMEGVFQRQKIIRAVRRPPSWISDLIQDLRQFATFVEPVPVNAVPKDPPDNLVIGTALAGGCEYLVSGNGHLLDLGTFQGIPILTPHEFLVVLRQGT